MVRHRIPKPKASAYVTREGYERLQSELKERWQRRADVTRALAAAAAEGDRSENAEYIYRKKELREIDRRIRYLQKRLPELTVVSDTPADLTRVFFGAWVTLEDDVGEVREYRIVGPDELDPDKGYISLDSPLARSLIKRAICDEVSVGTPGGTARYCIIAVRYG
ncbi:MAG: transcription elongation factor GreB [Pseudomonadota bacterium]|nr:MAG: transcription elongation factor GreB [Pseudomonadota bacterium]